MSRVLVYIEELRRGGIYRRSNNHLRFRARTDERSESGDFWRLDRIMHRNLSTEKRTPPESTLYSGSTYTRFAIRREYLKSVAGFR